MEDTDVKESNYPKKKKKKMLLSMITLIIFYFVVSALLCINFIYDAAVMPQW